MQNNNNVILKESSNKQFTAEEMRVWFEKNKRIIENYASGFNALKQLTNVSKNTKHRNVSSVTKEQLRTYLKNPTANESKLRQFSRYLYYRSQIYYRLVKFYANMYDLNARSVIPPFNLTKKNNNKSKILKSYNETLQMLDKARLQYEFLKIFTQCWRDDLFCGCAYWDETGLFILPLDLDYVKVNGVYSDSSFSFVMDMTYFNKNADLLEYWGEPFVSMYKNYEITKDKWQPMPDEYSVCLKCRAEDWETALSPLVGIFESLINLIELEDLQAIADEQMIYKLIWLEMETITGAKVPDDWKVDPDLMVEYFNRLVNTAIPDYAVGAIVPGKLNTITFDQDQTTDVSKIEKSTESVLNISGGAQVLNAASISGTTAWTGAIRSDTEYAISMLLPQAEAVVNRLLSFRVKNASKVKFFEVSIYTREELRKNLLENATYGYSTRLAVNALTGGFSELDTLSLNYLETECLDLPNSFGSPLQSSHTQSGKEAGGQTKDVKTDDGEASEDKRDGAK